MSTGEIIYRVAEALMMLYGAYYFWQLGRAKTERYSEARKRMADKFAFLENPKGCYGMAVVAIFIAVCRAVERIYEKYGPF